MGKEVRGRHRHEALGLPQGSDNVFENNLMAARGHARWSPQSRGIPGGREGAGRRLATLKGKSKLYFRLGLKCWAECRRLNKVGCSHNENVCWPQGWETPPIPFLSRKHICHMAHQQGQSPWHW